MMSNDLAYVVAIPARYAASRLPGKPLQLLSGEPLIVHVARRALASGAQEVWVAADDERIRDALDGVPVNVAMTSTQHASGSDRLAECARIAGWSDETIVVNLQDDEPFAPIAAIDAVARTLHESGTEMSTLATPIHAVHEVFDPNTVKVVLKQNGNALYFSRAPIPWARDAFARDRHQLPEDIQWLRHIGMYAYTAGFLRYFTQQPQSALEKAESLEQLRALELGAEIAVRLTPAEFPPGIDTPEDLLRAQKFLESHPHG